jgi:hypothetical protein
MGDSGTMKAKEYVEEVIADLISEKKKGATAMRAAFLGAALEIIQHVESPLKEQALVTLATLELSDARRNFDLRRKRA